MTIEIQVGDKWYEFPEGVSVEAAKEILLTHVIKRAIPEPVVDPPPVAVKMDSGLYLRDDGSYFEIATDGTVIEHGR